MMFLNGRTLILLLLPSQSPACTFASFDMLLLTYASASRSESMKSRIKPPSPKSVITKDRDDASDVPSSMVFSCADGYQLASCKRGHVGLGQFCKYTAPCTIRAAAGMSCGNVSVVAKLVTTALFL